MINKENLLRSTKRQPEEEGLKRSEIKWSRRGKQ